MHALQSPTARTGARIARAAAVIARLTAVAPSAIRGDLQTLAAAFAHYAQAFTQAGVRPGRPLSAAQRAQLASAADLFSTAKLQSAEQHLLAWATNKCGSAPTTTTG